MQLKSPAKINLYMRVLGLRPDGYHEIVTEMQAISLCDTLTFTKAEFPSLTCLDPTLSCDENNLIERARTLFALETGANVSYAIHLEKRIPTQGGLGGGSSNCATTLYGLNALSGSPLTEDELRILGGRLGADVPFFFSTGCARCEGIGEKVTSLPQWTRLPKSFSIVTPSFGVSTAKAFQLLTPSEEPSFLQLHKEETFHNDFLYPVVEQDERFKPFSHLTMLTGTGSSFYHLDPLENEAFPEGTTLFSVKPVHRNTSTWYDIPYETKNL